MEIAPPKEELEQLYELAAVGRLSALRSRVTKLEQLDSQYTPFANKIRKLVRGFEDDRILFLIDELLGHGISSVGASGGRGVESSRSHTSEVRARPEASRRPTSSLPLEEARKIERMIPIPLTSFFDRH